MLSNLSPALLRTIALHLPASADLTSLASTNHALHAAVRDPEVNKQRVERAGWDVEGWESGDEGGAAGADDERERGEGNHKGGEGVQERQENRLRKWQTVERVHAQVARLLEEAASEGYFLAPLLDSGYTQDEDANANAYGKDEDDQPDRELDRDGVLSTNARDDDDDKLENEMFDCDAWDGTHALHGLKMYAWLEDIGEVLPALLVRHRARTIPTLLQPAYRPIWRTVLRCVLVRCLAPHLRGSSTSADDCASFERACACVGNLLLLGDRAAVEGLLEGIEDALWPTLFARLSAAGPARELYRELCAPPLLEQGHERTDPDRERQASSNETRARSNALFNLLFVLVHVDLKRDGPTDVPVFPAGAVWSGPGFGAGDEDERGGNDDEDEDEGWLKSPTARTPLDALFEGDGSKGIPWTGHAFDIRVYGPSGEVQGYVGTRRTPVAFTLCRVSSPSANLSTPATPLMGSIFVRGTGTDEHGHAFTITGRYDRCGGRWWSNMRMEGGSAVRTWIGVVGPFGGLGKVEGGLDKGKGRGEGGGEEEKERWWCMWPEGWTTNWGVRAAR